MKKRISALLLAMALLFGLCVPVSAADTDTDTDTADTATLTVSQAAAKTGEQVEITVSLSDGDVYSGNFRLTYDAGALTYVSGSLGSGMSGCVNLTEDGEVRVSFASATQAVTGQLCTVTFLVTAETAIDGTAVSLTRVRLYNEEGSGCTATIKNGSVSRSCVRLSISSEETAATQAVQAEISLAGALQPAGGNFTVSYDPAVLKPASVVSLGTLSSSAFRYSVEESGVVRVSFAGTDALSAGPLCAVIFEAVGSAGTESTLTLGEARMYDEDGVSLDAVLENGSISITVPSTEAPALWVVGGAIGEDGSATASVLFQGQGTACGGSFTLQYDSAITMRYTAGEDVIVRQDETAGTLSVSWASVTPYSGETTLLTLTAENAVESDLTIQDADVKDKDGNAFSSVDVRSGKLSGTQKAAITVDDLSVDGSTLTATVAVTDLGNSLDCALAVAAAYDSAGRFLAVSLQEISLGEAGIGETGFSLSAANAAYLRVFLVSDSESFTPLCSAVEQSVE